MLRSSVIKGPAAIWHCKPADVATTPVYYTEGDIDVSVSLEQDSINTSAFGRIASTAKDVKISITATPIGIWGIGAVDVAKPGANFAARVSGLWPHLAKLPGDTLYPAAAADEKHLYIKQINAGASAEVYEFKCVEVEKMPSVICSTQKILCGPVTWRAIRQLKSADSTIQDWSVLEDSLVAISAAAFTCETYQYFATSHVLRDRYSAIWTGITGMSTATQSLDGFKIDFNMGFNDEDCDAYGPYQATVSPEGLTVLCKVTALGPTVAQMLTAMDIQNSATASRGKVLSGADLVISGSAAGKPKFTIYGAALVDTPIGFGASVNRLKEVTFQATRVFTGGAPSGSLAAIGTV